jgi:hypothetical protein
MYDDLGQAQHDMASSHGVALRTLLSHLGRPVLQAFDQRHQRARTHHLAVQIGEFDERHEPRRALAIVPHAAARVRRYVFRHLIVLTGVLFQLTVDIPG